MNSIWSSFIQGAATLYYSRALRFSDSYKEQYLCAFGLNDASKILEIGCGPGALCGSLKRWYPSAEVIGIDRDSAFIEFAAQKVPDVIFKEGDATALPFANSCFDATISNTVAEHIEPSAFFGEQYRVLKNGGVCLVLSTRHSISRSAPCITEESDFEKDIWARVGEKFQEQHEKYAVCRYPMTEQEYPAVMEKFGFRNVSAHYIIGNLTPDNPDLPRSAAIDMINQNRYNDIDGINMLRSIAADAVSDDEINELLRLTNEKYDKRIALYDAGEKQWDTNVITTMVIRGVK